MSIIRYRPQRTVLGPVTSLLPIESVFDRFFSDWYGDTAQPAWTPHLDVREEEDVIVVEADLPGLDKDDLTVSVDGDVLTLKGEKKTESDKNEGNVYRERFYGAFQRSIRIPAQVDAKKIDATYNNGVLKVTLAKSEAAKPREIAIVAG